MIVSLGLNGTEKPLIHAIPDLLRTVIAFVVVLGILVFIHEIGPLRGSTLARRFC